MAGRSIPLGGTADSGRRPRSPTQPQLTFPPPRSTGARRGRRTCRCTPTAAPPARRRPPRRPRAPAPRAHRPPPRRQRRARAGTRRPTARRPRGRRCTQPKPAGRHEHQGQALVDGELQRLGDPVGAELAERLEPEGVAVEGERGGALGDRHREGHGCVGHAGSDRVRDAKLIARLTYSYIGIYCSPWPEQPPPRTRSTPSPSPGGARSWTCSPAGSVPSTTWSPSSGWPSRRSPSTCGCSAKWERSTCATRDGGACTGSTARRSSPSTTGSSGFEQLWTERFDRLDDVLEDLKREEQGDVAGDE